MDKLMAPATVDKGKCLITSSSSGREAVSYSCGINIPTVADFNLPILCHSTQC